MLPYEKKTVTLLNKAELINEMCARKLTLPDPCTKEAMVNSLRKYHQKKNTKFKTFVGKMAINSKRVTTLLKGAATLFPNVTPPNRTPAEEIKIISDIKSQPRRDTRTLIHAESRLNHTPINVVNKIIKNKIQKTARTQQSDLERIDNYNDTPRQTLISQRDVSDEEFISFNATPQSYLHGVDSARRHTRASIQSPKIRAVESDDEFIHQLNNRNDTRQSIQDLDQEYTRQMRNNEEWTRKYEQLKRNYEQMNLQLDQEREQRIEAEKRQKQNYVQSTSSRQHHEHQYQFPADSRPVYRNDNQRNWIDDSRVLDKIRKWNITYNGDEETIHSFLEKMEEVTSFYQIRPDDLLMGIPMFLKDKASEWYRNSRKDWSSWEEFSNDLRKYFTPGDFHMQLEDQIRNRLQKTKEPAKTYVTQLQTLIRRYGKMSHLACLERLWKNMKPDYRRYIRRNDIQDVNDLVKLADEYERLVQDEKEAQQQEKLNQDKREKTTIYLAATSVNIPYNRNECCWRCGHRGHLRTECRNVLKKFCSHCGKLGTWSRDCQCPGARQMSFYLNNSRGPRRSFNYRPEPVYNAPPPVAPINPPMIQPLMPQVQARANVGPQDTMQVLLVEDNRAYVNVVIGNKIYQGLVDTGADKSFVGQRVWNDIESRSLTDLLPSTYNVTVADGNQASIIGKIKVEAGISEQIDNYEFLVMPKLKTDIILGVDILKQINLGIQFQPTRCLDESTRQVPEINTVFIDTLSVLSTKKMETDCEVKRFEEITSNQSKIVNDDKENSTSKRMNRVESTPENKRNLKEKNKNLKEKEEKLKEKEENLKEKEEYLRGKEKNLQEREENLKEKKNKENPNLEKGEKSREARRVIPGNERKTKSAGSGENERIKEVEGHEKKIEEKMKTRSRDITSSIPQRSLHRKSKRKGKKKRRRKKTIVDKEKKKELKEELEVTSQGVQEVFVKEAECNRIRAGKETINERLLLRGKPSSEGWAPRDRPA